MPSGAYPTPPVANRSTHFRETLPPAWPVTVLRLWPPTAKKGLKFKDPSAGIRTERIDCGATGSLCWECGSVISVRIGEKEWTVMEFATAPASRFRTVSQWTLTIPRP